MRTAIIVTVCVLVFLGGAFVTVRHINRKYAQPVADLSKMMSVRVTVALALSAYYEKHGSYSRSLSKLPSQTLKWGDEGSSERDLKSWSYNSDGESFTMTWTSTRNVKLFLGGKKGRVFYSENEMQH